MEQREKPDPFPTSVTPEQLWGPRFKPDPPKEPKGVWKLVRAGFIGAGLGIVACFLGNSGVYFLPVFGVVILLFLIESAAKSN